MPDKVPDASVLAALAFEEPLADEAERLLARADLHAPLILSFELTNVACVKTRQMPHERTALELALREALSEGIRWEAVDPVQVMWFALDNDLSAYDAAYLAVASAIGAELVTFDAKLGTVAYRLGLGG